MADGGLVDDERSPRQDVEVTATRDEHVPWRIFAAVGAFTAVIGVVYWGLAYEEAGTVMLLLTGALGLWCGVYLWLHARQLDAWGGPEHEPVGGDHVAAQWLPHASVWPLGIGVGLALVLNGLIIGVWFLIPGVIVLLLSIFGFAIESRRRD